MSEVRPQGYVERLSRDAIHGWAYDAAKPSAPVTVQLVLDGDAIAAATADIAREDLDALGIGRNTCGFELKVPAGTPINLDRLELCVAGSDAPLPVARDGGILEGVIEQLQDFTIGGWAWRVGSDGPVDLVLKHGDDELATFTADLYRQDLEQAGFGDGRHGFSYSFRALSRGHINLRNVALVFASSGERLFDLRANVAAAPANAEAAPSQGRPRPILGATRRRIMAERAAAPTRPATAPTLTELSDAVVQSRSVSQPSVTPETMQAISDALNLGPEER